MPDDKDKPKTKPLAAWAKAQTIGASKVGERTAPPTWNEILASPNPLRSLLEYAVGPSRPASVAAQDPYGISAWERGAGPMPIMMGTLDIKPGILKQGLIGEPGYVYHATNSERLEQIADTGKLKPFKPSYGTDQPTWPDGATERRTYFGASPEHLYQFAPEEGTPVVLRMKRDQRIARESTGDLFARTSIDARSLEYLGHDGAWHPLKPSEPSR